MEKLKIAIIADPGVSVPPILYGGIERIIYSLIEEYVALGHEVHLFANEESCSTAKLHIWKGKTTRSKLDVFKNIFQLLVAYKDYNFDVIHNFGRLAYLIPLLPFKVIKVMSYQREPTIRLIKKTLRFNKKGTLHFTGCSDYISNQIKPYAPASTIFNFVDIKDYNLTKSVSEDAPLFFLGRIDSEKGAHTAIEIAKKTNKKLIIAGNIPVKSEVYFEQEIKPNLGKKIIYIGSINDQQKNEYLGKSLALLMPITWEEPFGIVMVEAMACGTPVIGYSRGAVPEVIKQNTTGIYGNSIMELISGVNTAFNLDRQNVRDDVEKRFSSIVIAKQYVALFNHLMKKNENCSI